GNWNGTAPKCVSETVNCPALRPPLNGQISGNCSNKAVSGSQCKFSCDSGYALKGSDILTCSAKGNWDQAAPKCVQEQQDPTCPALDAPEHGAKGGACFEGARVGASCAFKCDDGYELTGKETLVCQADGNWDDDVPVCQEEPKNCPSIRNIVGGTTTGDCDPGVNNRLCAFSCNRGYYLIGTPALLCKDGSWSSRSPICRLPITLKEVQEEDVDYLYYPTEQ
ncbi:P-selectin-like protein, partial [Leptotrombidium deliense]